MLKFSIVVIFSALAFILNKDVISQNPEENYIYTNKSNELDEITSKIKRFDTHRHGQYEDASDYEEESDDEESVNGLSYPDAAAANDNGKWKKIAKTWKKKGGDQKWKSFSSSDMGEDSHPHKSKGKKSKNKKWDSKHGKKGHDIVYHSLADESSTEAAPLDLEEIFKLSEFYANFEATRIPFVSAAFKFIGEFYNDIYSYDTNKNGKPDFCGSKPCTSFDIVCRNDLYEVRKYPNITLIRVQLSSIDYSFEVLSRAYRIILQYLNGANDQNAIIPETVPKVTFVPKVSFTDESALFYSLFSDSGEAPSLQIALPQPFASNPPMPSDSRLKICVLESPMYYVSMFGGYALPSTFLGKARIFSKILQLSNQVIESPPLIALYDEDYTFLNRHNEVWYQAKPGAKDYCSSAQSDMGGKKKKGKGQY